MKKFFTIAALVAFSSTVMASTALTNFQTKVNNSINNINKKEQALTDKVEAKKAENARKKAEQKAKIEQAKKDAQARQDAQKAAAEKTKKDWNKAVESQKNFFKSLTTTK